MLDIKSEAKCPLIVCKETWSRVISVLNEILQNRENLIKYLTKNKMYDILIRSHRGVAQFGSALGSGPRGRGFESRHSDHKNRGEQ